MTQDLQQALEQFAALPTILVASDFDGVLAPLVRDPSKSAPLPAAKEALTGLNALERTRVALISGRARGTLKELYGADDSALLAGSHGLELQEGGVDLDKSQQATYAALLASGQRVADRFPGVTLETKPASIAVHYRRTNPALHQSVRAAIKAGPGSVPGAHPVDGKLVVEFLVKVATKATAVAEFSAQAQADGWFYAGDDLTDETVFNVASETDVTVKVGPGQTAARYRVETPEELAGMLKMLLDFRRAAVTG